jgi:hypothetical protein
LDVGTGTGQWARYELDGVIRYILLTPCRAVADAHKDAIVFGCDAVQIQPSIQNRLLRFNYQDASDNNWGWDGRFDYIHIREMDGEIRNWSTSLRAAHLSQGPGGSIEISDITVHPVEPASRDWRDWNHMLGRLQGIRGFSYGIHKDGRILHELQGAGYEQIESSCREYHLKQGTHIYEDCCLLQSFVGYMMGMLSLAFLHVPHFWTGRTQRELVQNLKHELLERGVSIKVWVAIIAPIGHTVTDQHSHRCIARKPTAGEFSGAIER